ncbi:MAG: glycosyltransferase family 2 protein [Paramuribaculum sp.]|nr:glycosyltransferase family 2 protein [Paramuribaculum sp.]
MTESPIITLILTVRNRYELLGRTLRSIAAQTFTGFNLIIVDNGSTDAAPQIIDRWVEANANRFSSVTVLKESIAGASVARNCGLGHVTTDYVMYFDSDDEMLPDHISRIDNYLRSKPQTRILRWDIGILSSDGWLEVKTHPTECDLSLQIIHSPLSTQRFAVSTALLNEAGGWDEELNVWIDWELGCRLILSGAEVKYLTGEPTVIVHPSDDSITGKSWSAHAKNHETALDKVRKQIEQKHASASDTEDDDKDFNRFLLTLDAKRAAAAGMYRREGNKVIANRTLQKACSKHNLKHRLALRSIYTATRLSGHGLSALSSIFFPKKRVKE